MKKEISCGAVIARQTENGREHRQVEEVTELCWVPAEEAAAHITFENDKDVLRKYREYCKA